MAEAGLALSEPLVHQQAPRVARGKMNTLLLFVVLGLLYVVLFSRERQQPAIQKPDVAMLGLVRHATPSSLRGPGQWEAVQRKDLMRVMAINPDAPSNLGSERLERSGYQATHGCTEPAVQAFVAEAAASEFVEASPWHQVASYIALAAIVTTIGSTETVPMPVRLVFATFLMFANYEYCVHRWVMHAEEGSFVNRYLAAVLALHEMHHSETTHDMSLLHGRDSDPKQIYFSTKTTLAGMVVSTGLLELVSAAFHLGFDLPSAVLASGVASLLHTSLWQTVHGDIHSYCGDYADGLPRVQFLSSVTPYTRWMITHHVGHHRLRGHGNYNIVLPGPDYLWGTCYHSRNNQ